MMKIFIEKLPLVLVSMMLMLASCAGVNELPDTPDEGEDVETPPADTGAVAGIGHKVDNVTATTADIVLTYEGKTAVVYHVTSEPLGNVQPSVVNRLGEKVSLAGSSHTITVRNLDAVTTYYYYIVTFTSDTQIDSEVFSGEFTTLDFNYSELLTVLERYHDGFRARITVPDNVKADTSRAIRYTVSSLPLYLQNRQDPDFNDFDGLEQNGQVFTRKDITVYYTDENQYVDEEGNPVPEEEYEASVDIQLHDKFAPGEPVVFMAGEFSARESLYGWKWGFYQPAFDTLRFWHTDPPQVSVLASPWEKAQASDSYWTGAFQKQIVMTNPPTHLDGDVTMEVVEKTAIDATLRLTPSDNVVQYCVSVIDDGTYQQLLPLIDNNEDYLQWYFTSIYAFMTGTATSLYGPTDLKISDMIYINKDEQTFHVYVVGMGNEEGTSQFFKQLPDVTTAPYSLPLPKIEIRPLRADQVPVDSLGNTASPYFSVSFNIKAPNKDVKSAVFACNYSREFEMMLNAGNDYNEIVEGGNRFTADEIAMINSDEGYTITFDSVPGETTRLAVLGYNAENRCNTITAADVADCSTSQRKKKTPVFTEYYKTLPGEWTASVKIESFNSPDGKYEYDDQTGEYKKFNYEIKENVTICSKVDYPSPMPESVYGAYPKDTKETVDSLYERFVELAERFNTYELANQNRLLCIGYCNHGSGLRKASPWDLFISSDYVGYDVEGIFYDFGPKWFLEMLKGTELDDSGLGYKADGIVVPYNSVTMAPFSNWDRYNYYMFPYSNMTNRAFTSTGEDGKEDGHVPVEISEDGNTITIKALEVEGNDYYLTPMYMRYGEPQAQFSVIDEIVLTRGWDGKESVAPEISSRQARRISATNLDGSKPKYRRHAENRIRTFTPLAVKEKVEYRKAEFKVQNAEGFKKKMKEIAEKYN